uniref:Uncharacterized protein n=1 Tax=Salix viminalis TaxID=40686 RepID=A0A6N2JZ40_SALVM
MEGETQVSSEVPVVTDDIDVAGLIKESFDAKSSGEADKPSVVERTREMLDAQEKLKELELELERVSAALKHSESENTRMKDDVLLAGEKLDEGGKKYGELEISHKKLQEQIMEAEEKFSAQLNTLQEALQAKETKHQELVEVKESFDGITLELENSRKKMQELEHELEVSSGEAKKFESCTKVVRMLNPRRRGPWSLKGCLRRQN